MPTYDYVCDACNHAFEIFQSFSEAPKKKCPDCGKRTLRRVISGGVGLVFKGSGFYVNDSRAAATAGAAKKSDTADGAAPAEKGSEKPSADKKSPEKSPEPKAAASAKPPAAKKQKPAAS